MAGSTEMALGPDFQLLMAASWDGSMIVWNMEVFEMLYTLPGHSAEPSPAVLMPEKSCDNLAVLEL